MSRLKNIITRVRDTLADPTADRWSDAKLIRLADEAQKDICKYAKLLRHNFDITILSNSNTLKMPDNFLLLDRVIYNGEMVPLRSHLDLDKEIGPDWEVHTGALKYIVYDKQTRGFAKLYPKPIEVNSVTLPFKVSSSLEEVNFVTDKFGFISEVDSTVMTQSNSFGVVGSVDIIQPEEQELDYTYSLKYEAAKFYEDVDLEVDTFGVIGSTENSFHQTSPFGITSGVDITNRDFEVDSPIEKVSCIDVEIPTFGVISEWVNKDRELIPRAPEYGIVAAIDGLSSNRDYGILTNIGQSLGPSLLSSEYGVTTNIQTFSDSITIYYIRKPQSLIDINSDLEIDESFDVAIKHYITGNALIDDMDTQNRTAGKEILAYYDRELKLAIQVDSTDFTRNNTQYNSNYIGAF